MMFHQHAGLRRLHFVGLGGVGMSGIAEILLDMDFEISGSDLRASAATDRLRSLGATFTEGHHAELVEDADLVVISSAVPPDNVEVVAARERGIGVVRRAEMLAELMRLKYGIAVAGTHGKTTTTSLIGTLLTEAGIDPTVIVGGRLRLTGTGARFGRSDFLVAEADEFDRSFLRLAPVIAIITNIDRDHLDTYADLDEIREAFVRFASRVPFFGQVIACIDNENVQGILPLLKDRRVVTYGLAPAADLRAENIRREGAATSFVVRHHKLGELGELELPLPGDHNVQNALAAVAVGMALDVDFDQIRAGLRAFSGVHRRFEQLGTFRGATVVDDYAHHPTEVAATLRAASAVFPGKVHAVFQPHLYSRTLDQADAFGRALLLADQAIVTDIYGSREEPMDGVDATLIVDAAKEFGQRSVRHLSDWSEIQAVLADEVKEGDVVLTMGAGDIVRFGQQLAAEGDA